MPWYEVIVEGFKNNSQENLTAHYKKTRMDSGRVTSNNFSDWLSCTTRRYSKFNDDQRNEVLKALIAISGPIQLNSLKDMLPCLVFRDFVSHLPLELLFFILKHLDARDLLSCCQVSKCWKERLDCLVALWSFKAKELGIIVPTNLASSHLDLPLSDNSTTAVDPSSKRSCDEEEDGHCERGELRTRGKLYKSYYLKGLNLVLGLGNGTSLTMHPDFISRCRINTLISDGNHIFIGTDTEVQMRSVPEGEILSSFTTHSVCDMTIKNSTIYTAFFNSKLESWDMTTGKSKNIFCGHTSAVLCVDVSDDERFVLTGSADKTAKLWSQRGSEVELIMSLRRVHHDWVVKVKFLSCDTESLKFITCDSNLIQITWFDLKTQSMTSQRVGKDLTKEFISFSYNRKSPATFFAIGWSKPCMTSQLFVFDVTKKGLELRDEWPVPGHIKAYIMDAGQRFMLVMCCISRTDFVLLDLKKKLRVARIGTPCCLLTRGTSTVVIHDTSWLDGIDIQRLRPGMPLFAVCVNRYSVLMGSWNAKNISF